jgi:3-oxoadipate enol-lactonase
MTLRRRAGQTSPVRSWQPLHRVDGAADGPTLLLVNSLATTTAMWDGFVPLVAERFRVVRFDLPGHGRAARVDAPRTIAELGEVLLRVLDAFGVEHAHLCGVSIGGMAAMWAAAHAPDRVERLVVCSSAAAIGSPAFWKERAETVRGGGLGAIDELVLERWLRPDATDRDAARDMIHATEPDAYVAYCEVLAEADLTSELPAIVAPTLVVRGADDPSIGEVEIEVLRSSIVECRVTVIENAAHLLPFERPEPFASAVLGHLNGSA